MSHMQHRGGQCPSISAPCTCQRSPSADNQLPSPSDRTSAQVPQSSRTCITTVSPTSTRHILTSIIYSSRHLPSSPYLPKLKHQRRLGGGWTFKKQNSPLLERLGRFPRHIRMPLVSAAELAYQARPRSEFLEHIKDCEPAKDLLRKLEKDQKDGETPSSS